MDLRFEDFQRMALDPGLNHYEKIGFPASYRKGKERAILRDILRKLTNLSGLRQTVLDVGPGCSDLARAIIRHCKLRHHKLHLFDSQAMLEHLPNLPLIQKYPGRFPEDCGAELQKLNGRADVILVYSVVQYVFAEGNIYNFLDTCLGLLAPGGQMLLGDTPNVSKRKRFFASESGRAFHRQFTKTSTNPKVEYNLIETGNMDDAVVYAVVARCRAAGFDAYVLPQSPDLPMANRREDILITRP